MKLIVKRSCFRMMTHGGTIDAVGILLTRTQKAKFLKDQARCNVKSFWKQLNYLNGKSGTSSSYCSYYVNDINNYFLSVQKETVKSLVLPSDTPCPTSFLHYMKDIPDFCFESVDTKLIGLLLRNLDTSKATGDDGLSATFVKILHSFLSTPATFIVNKSLSSGNVPHGWKKAIVTPIPKKKNASGLSHLIPISVLPVLSKILERVVQSQVIDNLISHDLLTPFQSGFRPGHSTQDVLHRLVDSWLACLDNRKCVEAIFLDLAKAFDCVDHSVLLKKLPYYGFRDISLDWFASCLTNRSQRVKCNGSISD